MIRIINTFTIIQIILNVSSISYACTPTPGDSWFVETLTSKNLPPIFEIKYNRLVPKTASAGDCVLLDENYFMPSRISRGANHTCTSSQIERDNRPANVSVPKNVDCKLKVFCEPVIHRIKFQIRYEKINSTANTSDKYYRTEALDKTSVPKEINIVVTDYNSHIINNDTNKTLCTIINSEYKTEERIRSLPLTKLYFSKSPDKMDSPPTIPLDFSFDVKCYKIKYLIDAHLTYSINQKYIPDLNKKASEGCSRSMINK